MAASAIDAVTDVTTTDNDKGTGKKLFAWGRQWHDVNDETQIGEETKTPAKQQRTTWLPERKANGLDLTAVRNGTQQDPLDIDQPCFAGNRKRNDVNQLLLVDNATNNTSKRLRGDAWVAAQVPFLSEKPKRDDDNDVLSVCNEPSSKSLRGDAAQVPPRSSISCSNNPHDGDLHFMQMEYERKRQKVQQEVNFIKNLQSLPPGQLAKTLVTKVGAFEHKLDRQGLSFSLVANCALAQRFVECRNEFRRTGRPNHVVIAYHYTRFALLESIQQEGLLSIPERQSKKVGPQSGGAAFGNGIYTGRSPSSFPMHDFCLMVAIVKGNERWVHVGQAPPLDNVDTVVGNKRRKDPSVQTFAESLLDEIVLRQSKQCLPLLGFFRTRYPIDQVWKCHEELQVILDRFLNGGRRTLVVRKWK